MALVDSHPSETGDDLTHRLMHAAAEVFAEKGYEKAGVAEIARRAGVTTGAIYNRFGGKAELLLEAVDHHVPASHFGSQVHPGDPLDTHLSVGQSLGDTLDPVTVTLPDQRVVVCGRSVGIEELAEGFSDISVKHLCGQHLVGSLFADRRKPDSIDLNRHRRSVPESEAKRHGGNALGEPMRRGG